MTVKQAYTRIRAHFATNGVKLGVDAEGCKLRTADGRKCAVGALIPDSRYRPEMEEWSNGTIVNRLWPASPPELEDYLSDVQMLHDDLADTPRASRITFLAAMDRQYRQYWSRSG